MGDNYFPLSIIQSNGALAGAGGQIGTVLAHKNWANSATLAPRSGNVNVIVVLSVDNPNPAVNIAPALIKGHSNFSEKWTQVHTGTNIAMNSANVYVRATIFQNIPVSAGEFIGVRVQNYEAGCNLNLAGLFLEYT
jgi:hypothetical protein